MRQSLTWIALFVASANAAQVTFRVVAPGASAVEVNIGGQLTPLTAADPTIPYFTGVAEAADGAKYKYVAGGTAEAFDRTLEAGKASTYNEFINRPITYANIPELPWPIENKPQWTRSGAKQPLFDTNYIPTVFIDGNPSDLNALITSPHKSKYPVTLTWVLANEVRTFKNVSFGIHGAGKKKNNAKQSWNWRLASGETYQNRDFFKLRHMEEDPTQIREKLWADASRAMGTFANEANMIRMFINGDGYGTFNLLDDITEYSYPSAMFYDGKPPAQMGALFDGASGASFQYFPDTLGYYSWVKNSASPEEIVAIGPLCEAWNKTVKTDDAQIAEFGKQFDTDMFLRFMVMEYLTGHWDGYWEMQTNDGVYRDPTDNNRWYYLGQDYDATFGVNIPSEDPLYIEWSYKQLETANPNAVMIAGLLQNPTQRATFEKYLVDTVKVLFNNVTLTNRVLKYHEFLLPDLEWDRSITQRSPGINFGWTFNQVTENLWAGVSSPLGTGGGAEFGLIEWISRKSEAVIKEFAITISPTPVGPPSTATQPPVPSGTSIETGTPPAPTDKPVPESAAGHVSPKGLATVALVGASLVALLF
ncbi:hypothetical protein BG011_003631 [Mortierella polycephala]|uniref:Uncharacterized protein n=1 Tax=Mortierella polycephala TaxID=41804 RepID=A0A9P6U3G3_9FUNG|nr:hypothetical protein BG011_003631 [Mortierella polycephala]